MTPHMNSPFGIVEQVFLLAFILMLLVGLAGGRSEAVVSLLLEIFGTAASAVMGLALMMLKTVFSLVGNIAVSGGHAWLNKGSSESSRHIDR